MAAKVWYCPGLLKKYWTLGRAPVIPPCPCPGGEGLVLPGVVEEILDARQVAGHHDVALPGAEGLESGGARGEHAVVDLEPLLLEVTVLERHPDGARVRLLQGEIGRA